MIGREKRVLLRHYLEQGMNKAVIARDLVRSPLIGNTFLTPDG